MEKESIRISLTKPAIEKLTRLAGSERKRGEWIERMVMAMDESSQPDEPEFDYSSLDYPIRLERKLDALTAKVNQMSQQREGETT